MKRPNPQQIKAMAIAFVYRAHGPILVGKLALHLGWWASIEETEKIIQSLVDEGMIRLMTPEEAQAKNVRYGFVRVV